MKTAYDLLIEKLSMQAGLKKIPLNGAFELTSRCNFNCKMCYVHDQSKDNSVIDRELTAGQWIKLAEDARDAGMLNLVLTGGEIFLRSDLKEIYERLSRMGFKITLYTNGSLIDETKAKWLGRIPPTSMEITLYGASADTYEKLCGNGSGYERTVRTVDMLLAEGINLELKMTVTYDNMNDMEQLAEFSYKRGLPLSLVDYLYPQMACEAPDRCRLNAEDMVDFLKRYFSVIGKLRETYSTGELPKQTLERAARMVEDMERLDQDFDKDSGQSAFTCKAGSSSFWVTWEGIMVPCGMMTEPTVNILETDFRTAWDKLTKGLLDIPACSECMECDSRNICDVCPAKLKTETGYYDRPAPYLCELARISREKQEQSGDKTN
jgi:radical SAM protein with 4Fe4S-binding SPASM domain